MIEYLFSNPSVLAAFLSAIATLFAAYATWAGPHSAAKLAEELRRTTASIDEKRRMKLWVFTTLMQERAAIASSESVRALNVIDVVFKDSAAVREAWAELFLSFDTRNAIPPHAQEERMRALLKAMAIDIGLGDGLRLDDFGRIYFPNALAEEERVRLLERQAALRRLSPDASPTANSAPQPASPFPPRPGAGN